MTKPELLDLLGVMLAHYRAHPKGTCKIMSQGALCWCSLCELERTIRTVESIEAVDQISLKIDIYIKPVVAPDFIELKLV